MQQIFAIDKKTMTVAHHAANLALIKTRMKELGEDENDFYILGDLGMKYVSRIVYVDGNCVYNNTDFWVNEAEAVFENYDEHEVIDIIGNRVDRARFATEMNSNITRIAAIDGRPGEVEYNIEVGNEFIALFREECILTDFTTITPLEIAQKLSSVILLVQTGSFREAKMVLNTIERDSFLTDERIAKYVSMLDAADAITYATPEEYFYTASEAE